MISISAEDLADKCRSSMGMATTMKNLAKVLARATPERMSEKDIWKVQQRWRQEYSSAVKEQTSRWKYRGLDWHTFSYSFKTSVHGGKAEAEYAELSPTSFSLFGGTGKIYGFRCRGPLPSIAKIREALGDIRSNYDVYIVAEDCSWTAVLTHEVDDPRISMFFSRADWPAGAGKV